jgi:cytochrome b pre-mRNA-processing protein 3
MSLASLFRRNRHRDAALRLYHAIVAQARAPVFFAGFGVPDTFDGRFELIALHGYLVLNRLKAEGPRMAELAQELFDVMFADFDRGLREMGVGDLGVGRQVKTMAQAFYGRIGA